MYVSMKGMLKRANEGNYAVMAINCFNIETARAVINAAQSLRAPIIINADTRKGAQIICENDDYEVKYKVYDVLNEKKEGC